MNALALTDLDVPLRALRTLAVEFPDLPAVDVQVSQVYPDRLELSIHNNLTAFEAWRTALGISPDAVAWHGEARMFWLEGVTTFAGAAVHLTGFAKLEQRVPAPPELVAAGGSA
ncbi:hypothetical protein GCM10011583_64570 [Streptomyces camponoticapitis]|uniref:Uncharacterized protein n=1 Tax=Streptomyces camponoticapitis TaxID=1616125 RepID=A0ABQ2EW74_9ACTN|nr:hypothetical protein [Streptomyces camponoticapitis]GGK23719.1 hypothetical protein GCM10011583_64570 [Streptomyces camponoticapitis]